jgi:hypothetical protein
MFVAERMSENTGDKHSPLVEIPNFIQATRDSGYRNTAAAFAEFVDNSLEAGATRIPGRPMATDQKVERSRQQRFLIQTLRSPNDRRHPKANQARRILEI